MFSVVLCIAAALWSVTASLSQAAAYMLHTSCRAQGTLPPEPAFSSDDNSDSEDLDQPQLRHPVQELRRRLRSPVATESQSDTTSDSEDESEEHHTEGEQEHQESYSLGEKAAKLAQQGRRAQRRGQGAPMKDESETADELPKKRVNKHAPVEERISRRPVSVLRDSMQRKGVKPLDPRFAPHLHAHDSQDPDLAHR